MQPLVMRLGVEFAATLLMVIMVAAARQSFVVATTAYAAAVFFAEPWSGGHCNPVVSLAAAAFRTMRVSHALLYVLVQISAAVLGGGIAWGFFEDPAIVYTEAGNLGAMFGVEILYTALLVMTVFGSKMDFYGGTVRHNVAAVALAMLAGTFLSSTQPVGYLNPALAIGVDISGGGADNYEGYGWAVAAVEFIGMIVGVAALMFISRLRETFVGRSMAEFVGTFYFAMSVGIAYSNFNPLTVLNAHVAGTLGAVTLAFSDVSGSHFNPAVTLAAMLAAFRSSVRTFAIKEGLVYMCVQFAGAFVGSFVALGITADTFPLSPIAETYEGWSRLFGGEYLAALFLISVVLSGMFSRKELEAKWAVSVALVFTAVTFFMSRNATAVILNPAVALSAQTAHASEVDVEWSHCLAYAVMDLVAGLTVGLFFVAVVRKEDVPISAGHELNPAMAPVAV